MQESFLTLANYRYVKGAAVLVAASLGAYAGHSPLQTPNGGTWLGYTLGTVGLVLILWLTAYGLRKRAYGSSLGSLRHWLSAHVWLGLSLLFIGTLHTGFQFGWNVHTLSYALMIVVIASGLWGVYGYARYPALMSGLLDGLSLREHGLALRELDRQAHKAAEQLPAPEQAQSLSLLQAAADEAVASGLAQRLSLSRPASATADAVRHFEGLALREVAGARLLAALMGRREQRLRRVRAFIRLRTLTEIWPLVHVPASLGLVAALVAHVVSVFYYW